jgi:hypothetical protein
MKKFVAVFLFVFALLLVMESKAVSFPPENITITIQQARYDSDLIAAGATVYVWVDNVKVQTVTLDKNGGATFQVPKGCDLQLGYVLDKTAWGQGYWSYDRDYGTVTTNQTYWPTLYEVCK